MIGMRLANRGVMVRVDYRDTLTGIADGAIYRAETGHGPLFKYCCNFLKRKKPVKVEDCVALQNYRLYCMLYLCQLFSLFPLLTLNDFK